LNIELRTLNIERGTESGKRFAPSGFRPIGEDVAQRGVPQAIRLMADAILLAQTFH